MSVLLRMCDERAAERGRQEGTYRVVVVASQVGDGSGGIGPGGGGGTSTVKQLVLDVAASQLQMVPPSRPPQHPV